jgi:hypothetical protein
VRLRIYLGAGRDEHGPLVLALPRAVSTTPTVVMLLDNHHGVDRRIRMESSLLLAAGADVRVIAWDRRPIGAASGQARFEEPPEAVGPAGDRVRGQAVAAL